MNNWCRISDGYSDLTDVCFCRIVVGNPGADGGTIVAGFLIATQDLMDDC